MSRIMLEGRRLSRRFRTFDGAPAPVLEDVSLEVGSGEILSIRGLSGSGKTTLLHLMATIDRPDAGSVWIEGRETSGWSGEALAEFRRRRLGIIYQDCGLIPRYTVWQNVTVSLVPDGAPASARREQGAGILERVGLGHKLDERPTRLSGGEQQRVAIARALVQSPAILVADEPTSQVDRETTAMIIDLFDELRARGAAILVASHEPDLWARSDVCLQLVDGRLVAETDGLGPAP